MLSYLHITAIATASSSFLQQGWVMQWTLTILGPGYPVVEQQKTEHQVMPSAEEDAHNAENN